MNLSLVAQSGTDSNTQITENEFGETALPFAPSITSACGRTVTPQQFLDVNRSLASAEAILTRVSVPENYMLFAGEENGAVYLLCAVIGHENYVKRPEQRYEHKVVYGRRWLLEPSTPTSEVVQTALLAVKKAREHELRERVIFKLIDDEQARRTTPFNCHMDLPLMASEATSFAQPGDDDWNAEKLLARLEVDGLRPSLYAIHGLGGGRFAYDIRLENIGTDPTAFGDLQEQLITVTTKAGTQAEFLHQLFNQLLQASDAYVERNISFEGFARFDQRVCPSAVAEFSYRTRRITQQDERFSAHFSDMSYRVDAAKAPYINNGELGERQRSVLQAAESEFGALAGYLPLEIK